jgi:DHA1 family inner membrane transport protein
MPFALYILAAGVFVISSSEFVVMGLLPNLARDLHVSIASAGFLVSGYALGVVLGAPLLTPLLTRLPSKRVLTGLMVLFTVGNTVCALAPGYDTLLVARIVTAFAQATFLGLGAVVATQLVSPEQRARAISAVFLGSTVATMFGAPAGTGFGQAFGWRATFWVLSAIAALTTLAIAFQVPQVAAGPAANLKRDLRPCSARSCCVRS